MKNTLYENYIMRLKVVISNCLNTGKGKKEQIIITTLSRKYQLIPKIWLEESLQASPCTRILHLLGQK